MSIFDDAEVVAASKESYRGELDFLQEASEETPSSPSPPISPSCWFDDLLRVEHKTTTTTTMTTVASDGNRHAEEELSRAQVVDAESVKVIGVKAGE